MMFPILTISEILTKLMVNKNFIKFLKAIKFLDQFPSKKNSFNLLNIFNKEFYFQTDKFIKYLNIYLPRANIKEDLLIILKTMDKEMPDQSINEELVITNSTREINVIISR